MHYFYTSGFLTLCFVLSVIDGKIEQHVCIKFRVKLGKSATENFEMLHEAFGEHSLSWTAVFFNGIHVLRPVECKLKMNIQGNQAPTK
jgi:hypothetical protein